MTRIILSGCCGRMGKMLTQLVSENDGFEIIAGVDAVEDASIPYPVFSSFSELNLGADAIIDFSNPVALSGILAYASARHIPAVLATTGYSPEQCEQIKTASQDVPLFFSANMSLGVSLLCELAKNAAKVLGNSFDIEIVEAHHNQKLDAPSGTALMLANEIKTELEPDVFYNYDRHSSREKRKKNEIGIHSVRGGTITGEHEIIFAGKDEVLKLSHSAGSRTIFACGALNAAAFLVGKSNGLYSMKELINA